MTGFQKGVCVCVAGDANIASSHLRGSGVYSDARLHYLRVCCILCQVNVHSRSWPAVGRGVASRGAGRTTANVTTAEISLTSRLRLALRSCGFTDNPVVNLRNQCFVLAGNAGQVRRHELLEHNWLQAVLISTL